jgi:hypothetical protein
MMMMMMMLLEHGMALDWRDVKDQSPNNLNTMKSIHLSTHKIKSVYVQNLKPNTKESRNQGKGNRS